MHCTIILSTALLQLTSALFAPSNGARFERLEGVCRTADFTTGTFRKLLGVSRAECEAECIRDGPSCVAYEYNEHSVCEIHSEEITQTAPGNHGVTCDIKLSFSPGCTRDTFPCPSSDPFQTVFLSRDPNNNCEFNFHECPQETSCALTGGEVVEHGWSGSDTGGNSCNRCTCHNGVLGCTKMNCWTGCNPNLFCGQASTCFDGKLYPTTCGPSNCDMPISETCATPEPTFTTVTYWSCQSHGLLPITEIEQCQHAARELHYDITSDVTSHEWVDVVDGCSVRTQSGELFHNTQGTCDPINGFGWAFRGCQCSDLNPCLCKSV